MNSFIIGYLTIIFSGFLFIVFLWLFILLFGFLVSEIFAFAYSRLNDRGIFFTFVEYHEEYDKKHNKRKLNEKTKTFED